MRRARRNGRWKARVWLESMCEGSSGCRLSAEWQAPHVEQFERRSLAAGEPAEARSARVRIARGNRRVRAEAAGASARRSAARR